MQVAERVVSCGGVPRPEAGRALARLCFLASKGEMPASKAALARDLGVAVRTLDGSLSELQWHGFVHVERSGERGSARFVLEERRLRAWLAGAAELTDYRPAEFAGSDRQNLPVCGGPDRQNLPVSRARVLDDDYYDDHEDAKARPDSGDGGDDDGFVERIVAVLKRHSISSREDLHRDAILRLRREGMDEGLAQEAARLTFDAGKASQSFRYWQGVVRGKLREREITAAAKAENPPVVLEEHRRWKAGAHPFDGGEA